jgi:hypothetical protein
VPGGRIVEPCLERCDELVALQQLHETMVGASDRYRYNMD